MELRINHDSDVAPFEQLRQRLIDDITARRLRPGTKLPSVRALAAELGLAANTVARSYKELEAEGYLITRGRAGTVVSDIAAVGDQAMTRADDLTATYVAEMRRLGIGDDAIVATLRRAL